MNTMRQARFVISAAIIFAPMVAQADPVATWFEGFSGCGTSNAPCLEAPGITAGSLTGTVPADQTSGYVPPDGNNLWSLRNHNWLDFDPAKFWVVMTADWIANLDSMDLTVFTNDCQRSYVVIPGCVSATWGIQTSVNGGPFGAVLETFGGTDGAPNGVHTSVSVALDQTLNPGDYITFQVSVQDPGNAYSYYGLYTGQYHFYDIRVNGNTVQPVAIDIKPGSDPNCFNVNGHGVIPVAILGSDTFDVTNIDQFSLLFGGLEVRVRGKKRPLCGLEYSNGDTYFDLVCHFEDDVDSWNPGDGEATLTGSLFDLTEFEGTDSICVVP